MALRHKVSAVLATTTLLSALPAQATLGVFEHGAGIRAQGRGGVTYTMAPETTAIGLNPALLSEMGNRYDIGLNVLRPRSTVWIKDNALGEDSKHFSDRSLYLFIPQGGWAKQLNEHYSIGVTMQSAGIGPDYDESPYARLGATSPMKMKMTSTALSLVSSYHSNTGHSFGAALNLGYQKLKVEGLQFLAPYSTSPNHVSNAGSDGSRTLGFSVGWHGELAPGVTAGIGYRSKNWTEKHKKYKGLLADGGSLELPAIWGGALAWQATDTLQFGFEYQKQEYSKIDAFEYGLDKLTEEGKLMGSKNGPGFAFKDMRALKFGATWKASETLELSAGYIRSNQVNRSGETLFSMLAPVTLDNQYTLGLVRKFSKWSFSAYYLFTPGTTIYGNNSIPDSFGGGEVDVKYKVKTAGISFGRSF